MFDDDLAPLEDLVAAVQSDHPGLRHRGDTPAAEASLSAACRNAGRAGSQRRRVLAYMAERGEATNHEIERDLLLRRPSGSNRRGDLETIGLLEATDRTRPTPTGSPAVVYRITDLGRAVHAALEAGA